MSENHRSGKLVELIGAENVKEAFQKKVGQRRWAVALVTFGISLLGLWLMIDIVGAQGWTPLEVLETFLFGILFANLAFGFTQAFLGFLVLAEGHEPLKITNTLDATTPLASTAVVMPVYNEDAETVFGNVQALYRSLQQRHELDSYDFYILSDSTDPAKAVEEELAWSDICRQTNGFGKIHYRRRKLPVNRKSGNIADFCRRWGHRHRYMVVLDADSLMTGTAVSSLVRLMETNPRAGIIQTMPRLVKTETLFGRIQQFASRVYSPIFAAGLNFWQQGAGNYWGHNAIIRIAPFLASCALPGLPGKEPLGGRILSHDFVEAALMRNAGWEVWFAYDLEGSYEGLPPNLTEFVKRDRRWCQGNLQHMWFLLAQNIRAISRLHLVQGILAYGSAPLLVLFVFFGGLQAGIDRLQDRVGAFSAASAGVLLLITLILLFGPKVLSLLHLFARRTEVDSFGGPVRVLLSAFLETFFSILIAPVLVWFHTRFVFRNIAGQTVTWNTQTRAGGTGPGWSEIVREYWPLPIAGVGFGALAWWIAPSFLAWLSPMLVGLILAIPVAKLSARTDLLRRFFLTPEELEPPPELIVRFQLQLREGDQFVHAVLDPFYNAVHVALQRSRETGSPAVDGYVANLAAKLFKEGPGALTSQEKRALLADGETLAYMHNLIWKTPSELMNSAWAQALAQYRSSFRRARSKPESRDGNLPKTQPAAAA
ncbi:MAG: glucans biosynthesis glucosyltransferase MdoH [Verrucomicrobia bacterium]|nr:glucans biosynthesis glucosyltransferase MdoH [Verrucomicrobiota bacterium]